MISFTVRRLVSMLVVLFALLAILFILQAISPMDPVRAYVGQHASQAVVNAARKRLGYDSPLPVQYIRYVGRAVTGNLGMSLATGRPVLSDIGRYLTASLELVCFSLFFAVPLALFYGLIGAAGWRGSSALRTAMLALAAAPPFLLAIVGIVFFYQKLGWLPASGRSNYLNAPGGPTGFLTIDGLLHGRPNVTLDALRHLVLPAFVLSLVPAVAVGRVLRGSIVSILRTDQIRLARAKGLGEVRILLKHCLRNAAGPSLAMSGLMLGMLFANLIVVETVFAWPGIGSYVSQAIARDDFPATAGVTLMLGAAYVVINTGVDLLQAWADPRIRK
ncbi:MAG TPA: ABC transporter permease [Solirubrobacteraceae bacterium]|jgi:peptide/nickel transport system permease protein|nr:ABC transporter permease [Solirubrobacteraceae bacterium]